MKKLRLDSDVATLAVTGFARTCYGKPTCVAARDASGLGDCACTCRPP